MGIAMAGMLARPHHAAERRLGGVFGVLAVWFGYRVVHDYQAGGARRWRSGTARRTWCTARRCSTCSSRSGARRGGSGMGGMGGDRAGCPRCRSDPRFLFALILIGYRSGTSTSCPASGTASRRRSPAGRARGRVGRDRRYRAVAGSDEGGGVAALAGRSGVAGMAARAAAVPGGCCHPGLAGDRRGLPDRHRRHHGADADPLVLQLDGGGGRGNWTLPWPQRRFMTRLQLSGLRL